MNNPDHVPDKRLVTGGSGTGKTSRAQEMFLEEKARFKFVYDHDGRYSSRFGPESVDAAGLDVAVAAGGTVVYDPSNDFTNLGVTTKEMGPGGLSFFCEYLMATCKILKGRKILFVDELDLVSGNACYPKELHVLMQTGRNYMIDCILITGQPNRVHNCVLTQCTSVTTFLHTAEPAMKWLVQNGIEEDTIRGLGDHGWFQKNLRSGECTTSVKTKRPLPEAAGPPDTYG
jgi:hypothetical protein